MKNPKALIPKTWTSAKVRVNAKGKVQISIPKSKVRNPLVAKKKNARRRKR